MGAVHVSDWHIITKEPDVLPVEFQPLRVIAIDKLQLVLKAQVAKIGDDAGPRSNDWDEEVRSCVLFFSGAPRELELIRAVGLRPCVTNISTTPAHAEIRPHP
jgi:hypothetical protein